MLGIDRLFEVTCAFVKLTNKVARAMKKKTSHTHDYDCLFSDENGRREEKK
jgi:hypothetical protein